MWTFTGNRDSRTPDAAVCTCLLAPACLHRTAVLARAPIADDPPIDTDPGPLPADDPRPPDGTARLAADPLPGDTPARTADEARPGTDLVAPTADRPPSSTAGSADGEPDIGRSLTDRQRGAAGALWRAAVAVLEAGITGSGVVVRTALLRATHEARAQGLHRAAAAGRQVASRLQAARDGQPQHRLADLSDDLRELLTLSYRLGDPALPAGEVPALCGTARRAYDLRGSLRLYGLCTEPVVAESGYAGTVTYLVDRDGRIWTVADIAPGDAGRAAGTGDRTVALGEAAVSHRALTRSGLVVSGATASESGQLGAGRSVRAVQAGGARWTEEPLAPLWRQPLAEQVPRAFEALALPVQDRPAGADLLFLPVRLIGPHRAGVLAVTGEHTVLTVTVAADHPALPFRENLTLLAGAPGLDLLLVARPDPTRRATVQALAVGLPAVPDDPATAGEEAASRAGLGLPPAWGDHVDLGYDRLHRSHLRVPGPSAVPAGAPSSAATGDPSLQLLRRHLERVVSGGRAVQALVDSDERRLRRARLDTGAELLAALTAAARARPRDAFGRLAGDDGEAFARSWLAAAVYEQAASRALTEASWLPGAPLATAG